MLTIIVRSKRDKDAVEAALNKFYRDWEIVVETLQGARTPGAIIDKLDEIITRDRFYLLLLGREDKKSAETLIGEYDLPPNLAIHVVPRSRVRNARIEHIASEIARGKSLFRLAASWQEDKEVYVFGLWQGTNLVKLYGYSPAYDAFLGVGLTSTRIISEIVGGDIGYPPLIIRKFSGLHEVYNGPYLIAILKITDNGISPRGELVGGSRRYHIPLSRIVGENRNVLKLYENIAISFLKKYSNYDTIIVPWSGGKDSTATLLLALQAYPRSKIKVVFTDTGTEFPETLEYIEKASRKLGVEVYKAYAKVYEGIAKEGIPLPTHENRWCTGRKLEATRKAIELLAEGKTLVIVGDREAESRRRAIRPPYYNDSIGYTTLLPLKLWGATHVQLYILSKGIELNPLYEYGFYRIGCYMCPALRSWELYLVSRIPRLYIRLSKSPVFRKFIVERVFKKPRNNY